MNDGMPTHLRPPARLGPGTSLDSIGISAGASSTHSTSVLAVQLVVAARERGAAGEVGEVRAVAAAFESSKSGSSCTGTSCCMSSWVGPAACVRAPVPAWKRNRRPLLLLADPLVELGGFLGDHPEAHVRVRQPAVLRALAEVRARLVGLDRRVRSRAPGTTSRFPFSSGTQKLWITLHSFGRESSQAGEVDLHRTSAPGSRARWR